MWSKTKQPNLIKTKLNKKPKLLKIIIVKITRVRVPSSIIKSSIKVCNSNPIN